MTELIMLSIYGSTALVDLGRFFSFLIYTQSVGPLGRGISQLQSRYLHTEQHRQNKRTRISMPRVRFEPTTPVFERAKTVHALHRAATVIGNWSCYRCLLFSTTTQERNRKINVSILSADHNKKQKQKNVLFFCSRYCNNMVSKHIFNNLYSYMFNFILVCANSERWSFDIDSLFIQYIVLISDQSERVSTNSE
jgi:hypothetical protein